MRLVAWFLALSLLSATGCSIRATTDQILDTTTNVTGTTSSARSWFSEDGSIKPEFKTTAFVAFNRDNLRQDLAAGQGEYLSSMSALLGVPGDRQPAFFSAAQARYALATDSDSAASLALRDLLQDAAEPFTHVSQFTYRTPTP
jgi:hypothetical protein